MTDKELRKKRLKRFRKQRPTLVNFVAFLTALKIATLFIKKEK